MKANQWHPGSWRVKEPNQIPKYADSTALLQVEQRISNYPGLVATQDVDALRRKLSEVYFGHRFVIQAGDCSETFANFNKDNLAAQYQLITDMAGILQHKTGRPVVRIGRIAGQYAKPRSSAMEQIGGIELPSYRGDLVNDSSFDANQRHHDPARMEIAYFTASATMNGLRHLDSCYQKNNSISSLDDIVYTSHEALHLPYEQTFLQRSEEGRWYCHSAHFLWIGERTRQLDGAHVEFLRGIENPIGVKVGPSMTVDELLRLVEVLDPFNDSGRLTLISRFGAHNIPKLTPLIEALQREGRHVCWICDPMHGNTIKLNSGLKTRNCYTLASEIQGFLQAHHTLGKVASGLHLEASGLDVTECLGGPTALVEEDLNRAYFTTCDPRLNPIQAKAIAKLTAEWLSRNQVDNGCHIEALNRSLFIAS